MPNSKEEQNEKTEVESTENAEVSIIIPCYNAERFLDEVFVGLEKQTFKNFELICINDGSKDNTLSVLRSWEKRSSLKITVIDKENGGVSAARNDGIKAARGKYILFLDADDMYHKAYIERLFNAIEETGADVAYCRLDRNYDNVMSVSIKEAKVLMHTQTEAMNNLLYRMSEFGFCCYIYNKDVLQKYSIEFDCNTITGEDREFNWKYLCHCKNACFIDAPLYWYRVNNQSVTKAKASWKRTGILNAIERVEKYMLDNGCEFLDEFKSYMYARTMWACAKVFAVSRDKELFNRLRKEYDVRKCMKRTTKDKNRLVALSSRIYLFWPWLYYKIIGMHG